MTTSPVAGINDDELASIREYVKRQDKADNSPVCIDFRELRGLVSRLQDAEKDAARYRWLRDERQAFADFLALDDVEGEWRRVSISDSAVDTAMEQQP